MKNLLNNVKSTVEKVNVDTTKKVFKTRRMMTSDMVAAMTMLQTGIAAYTIGKDIISTIGKGIKRATDEGWKTALEKALNDVAKIILINDELTGTDSACLVDRVLEDIDGYMRCVNAGYKEFDNVADDEDNKMMYIGIIVKGEEVCLLAFNKKKNKFKITTKSSMEIELWIKNHPLKNPLKKSNKESSEDKEAADEAAADDETK